ncbi:MAG: response regulator transcription factor [Anaerolineales bacterium]
MKEEIRVLIADDHAIVRDGIRALLVTEPRIVVVGEACNGVEAVREAQRLCPDVVLMDLVMPEMDGVEATRRILADRPEARVLVLTSFAAESKVLPALKSGAVGYLLKDSGAEELVAGILQVHKGQSPIDPSIARDLIREITRKPSSASKSEELTVRETEVLKLLARGLSNQEIAEVLVISDATVRNHVSSILNKLQLPTRTRAALYAIREGLAPLEDEEAN